MAPYRLDVNVFLQNNDYVRELEKRNAEMQALLEEANRRAAVAESKSLNELYVNMELTDLLHANGIQFRPTADMRTWSDKKGRGRPPRRNT